MNPTPPAPQGAAMFRLEGSSLLRTREYYLQGLKARIHSIELISQAGMLFLAEAYPHVKPTTIDFICDRIASHFMLPIEQEIESLEAIPEELTRPTAPPPGPTYTAEDLIKLTDEINAYEESLASARAALAHYPEEQRGLMNPQILMAERHLNGLKEARAIIQAAIERQDAESSKQENQ